MSYKRDLSAIFGRKAEEFTENHVRILKRLWDAGRREGVAQAHGEMKAFVNTLPLEETKLTDAMPYKKFTPEMAEQMAELWRSVFLHGRERGQVRLQTIFTRVITREPVHEVMDLDSATSTQGTGNVNVRLKQWVLDAYQAVLDAPDLDAAQEAADEAKAKHRQSREQEQMLRRMNEEIPMYKRMGGER